MSRTYRVAAFLSLGSDATRAGSGDAAPLSLLDDDILVVRVRLARQLGPPANQEVGQRRKGPHQSRGEQVHEEPNARQISTLQITVHPHIDERQRHNEIREDLCGVGLRKWRESPSIAMF